MPSTKLINDLLSKKFLPLLPDALKDQDPIPLFSLKLVSSLLERSPSFIGALKRNGVVAGLFESFSPGHPRLNSHLIKVVKRIIETWNLTIEEVRNLRIIERVNNVMRSIIR